ncbi:transposase, Ptta/En/Spm [Tanacetum coccineum]
MGCEEDTGTMSLEFKVGCYFGQCTRTFYSKGSRNMYLLNAAIPAVGAVSEKMKIVRSKSYEPHALGTKSFARLADEEKKKTGVLPTRGTLYIMSRTKNNGSIVNATSAKVIKELLNDASTRTSNTTNDASTSTSNTTTCNGIVDWSNDDLARVKGKEKGDYTRCVRPNIRLPMSKISCVSQVPMLNARINKLKVEMKDLKERQHIEMKEIKENQAAILQFMAKVANDSSSVHNPGPYGNSTSTRASENKKSDKAVTSPGASKKITHLSSAKMQLRKKFLEEDRQLMKLHQQFVMSGLMSDNEFWCVRKVKQRVGNCHQTLKTLKRDDVQLLRKFGIQFKGDSEQVRFSEKAATTRSAF